jgi:hypothetical protein
VGLLSVSMIFICSVIEPGQPCVTMCGNAFVVFGADILLVVVCFSSRILGRFPALHQFAGFACLFGFSAFISLSSSGVI